MKAVRLPGDPLVVRYAPQLEVLSRARLTLTHAGLNTVLDSIQCGVPMVAVPLTYEQPAIARRVEWTGAGIVANWGRTDGARLKQVVNACIEGRKTAEGLEPALRAVKAGTVRAADLVQSLT